MFILGNLLVAVSNLFQVLIHIYTIIVIISALLSWVNPDPYNPFVRILYQLTEPVYNRVRRWLPFVRVGGLDLAPLVVLLALQLFNGVVVMSLHDLGLRLKLM